MSTNTLVLCRIWGFVISTSSADTDEHRTELAGVILVAQVRSGGACDEHQRTTVVLIPCRVFCNIWSHGASVTAMPHNKFQSLVWWHFRPPQTFCHLSLELDEPSSSFAVGRTDQNRLCIMFSNLWVTNEIAAGLSSYNRYCGDEFTSASAPDLCLFFWCRLWF